MSFLLYNVFVYLYMPSFVGSGTSNLIGQVQVEGLSV